MSIFATPNKQVAENQYGFTVLFLHGLEGSPNGKKSTHLKKEWAAFSPSLRTNDMINLRSACKGDWSTLDLDDIDEALESPYQDALDAVNYVKPDIIVGSSMGAALLFRLYSKGDYEGAGVFLAPAVPSLIGFDEQKEAAKTVSQFPNVWLLGEADTVVSNKDNVYLSRICRGSLMFSPNDSHRLENALSAGLIDSAILTAFEMLNN